MEGAESDAGCSLERRYALPESRKVLMLELNWLGQFRSKCLEEAEVRAGRILVLRSS